MTLPRGLYEALVTEGLRVQLESLEQDVAHREQLRREEVPDRVALHLSRLIEAALATVSDEKRVGVGIVVAREILTRLAELTGVGDLELDMPVQSGDVLRAIGAVLPDGSARLPTPPLIPLLDTTLLTNSPGEPRVGHQIVAEIESAARIDVLMAFIRRTGIAPMREALRRHIGNGGQVRFLTTVYTGATEPEALNELQQLGAQIRVSYDVTTTRLHAKAWIFHRGSGFSTAYVGSSNLTHSAQVSGLEWNIRVSEARNRPVIEKVRAVFDTYWESGDFEQYESEEFMRRLGAARKPGPVVFLSPVAVEAKPFQERLLEQISVSRIAGFHRNLLVAATGTGKTVMAALDYARLRQSLPSSRLLFVAHRREILDQSQATFRHVLRDPSFGEQWVAGRRPERFDHVFASIQTLNGADLALLDPKRFDVVVVDEFHHSAADSYVRILGHMQPVELLGLTATPERSDGRSVMEWFGGRIAAELRLWDAIDQHYLTPFCYYGLHDHLDLRQVPWRRGVGYDLEALTNVYTGSDVWAEFVVKEFAARVPDIGSVRALGFCASVRHARYMAEVFNRVGVQAAAVSGESRVDERAEALEKLNRGALRVVFSVDVFNEGVDIPSVDAILMLRPTESGTLFLQQLGRGLRRISGKTTCVVLDFVGTHRQEFRFDRRFQGLLGGTRKEVQQQVKLGFPYLPAGCHMQLDPVAQEIILESIQQAIPSRWVEKVAELRAFIRAGHPVSLQGFLEHSGLELEDIYTGGNTWTRLCADAEVVVEPAGPEDLVLGRALGRLLHVDDEVRITGYASLASNPKPPDLSSSSVFQLRLARMLVTQLVDGISDDTLPRAATLDEGLRLLWRHPRVLSELRAVLEVLRTRIDHVHVPLVGRAENPIKVHGRYTRSEIVAAFGLGAGAKGFPWREGVRWVPEERADLFAITFDKADGNFSPTTRYRDYAMSRDLVHWESQSMTRATSETGLRYQQHQQKGSDVVMFARLRQDSRAFWCLGPASYVRHDGERPMSIVWRLRQPLPGDLFSQFAAAVA